MLAEYCNAGYVVLYFLKQLVSLIQHSYNYSKA